MPMKKEKIIKKKKLLFLADKKLWIGIVLCLLYFGVIGVFGLKYKEESNVVEMLCYISQIMSGFFVVAGTVIAVIQYISNSNIARREADKQRKIEAAKMANEFRQNVLPLVNELSIAYSESKLRKDVIKYLDDCKLELFNKEEIDNLFPEDLYVQYQAMVAQNYLLRTDEKYRELCKKYRNCKTENEREKIEKELNEYTYNGLKKVNAIVTDLSNSLEYMCICFNTNIADDETVYQSLHHTFFLAVHMIYIFVFIANTNEHDRLFYNIMVLYKKWKVLYCEKKLEEENDKEKIEEEINLLKVKYHNKITVSTKCE